MSTILAWKPGMPWPGTFTRASTAYYKNRNLLLEQAAVDELRDKHWVTKTKGPCALLEPGSTNKLLYSEEFDNAAWIKLNASISANATAEPLAIPATTADKLIEDTSGPANHGVYQDIAGIADGAVVAVSVFAKTAERSHLCIQTRIKDGTLVAVYFNLSAGQVGTIVGTTIDQYVEEYGNGWYRCVVILNVGSGTYNLQPRILIAYADGNNNYTGDGSSGIYIWGAQLEQVPYATSYMPSGASSGTRAQDHIEYEFPTPLAVQPMTAYLSLHEIGAQNLGYWPPVFAMGKTSVGYPAFVFRHEQGFSGYNLVIVDGDNYGIIGTDSVFTGKSATLFANQEYLMQLGASRDGYLIAYEDGVLVGSKSDVDQDFDYLDAYTHLVLIRHPLYSTGTLGTALRAMVISRGVKTIDEMRQIVANLVTPDFRKYTVARYDRTYNVEK